LTDDPSHPKGQKTTGYSRPLLLWIVIIFTACSSLSRRNWCISDWDDVVCLCSDNHLTRPVVPRFFSTDSWYRTSVKWSTFVSLLSPSANDKRRPLTSSLAINLLNILIKPYCCHNLKYSLKATSRSCHQNGSWECMSSSWPATPIISVARAALNKRSLAGSEMLDKILSISKASCE